ncbi:MAG: DUF3298 domain-containing protein [Acidobacteria bacterium]|nr:DUF3298 domain-containing protein [Acidobacteriota bacterium]
MINRFTAIFFTAILLFAATACSKKKEAPTSLPTTTGQTEIKPDAVSDANVNMTAAPKQFHKTFIGTMNGKLDIEMTLERQGQKITGSYFYTNLREAIDLEGSIDKDGVCKINETINDQKTGVFNGKLNGAEINGVVSLRFDGTWANAKGDKPMPFALREQTFNLSNGAKLVTKTIKEASKKEHYDLEANYPQIEGANTTAITAFNKTVSTFINERLRDFKKETPDTDFYQENPDAPPSGVVITHNILMANDEMISVIFGISTFTSGAAHPNNGSHTLNYDLKNNKEIALRELFTAGANYLPTLASLCAKSLQTKLKKLEMNDEALIAEGTAATAENYQSWNLTPKGLLFTFDPYQVAAYAAGPQEVLIPYASMKTILKADSPAGQLLAMASLSK